MKKFFLSIIVAGAALGLCAASFAQAAGPKGAGQGGAKGGQQGQGQGQRQGMRMRMQQEIFAKLKLTNKQKDQIKALGEKQREKMQTLRKDIKPGERPSPQIREKFQAMQKSYVDGLKKILTSQQFTEYEKLMKEAVSKMRQGGGRPGAAPAGAAGGAKGGAKGGTKKGGGGGGL